MSAFWFGYKMKYCQVVTQLTFTYSKSAIEMPEKGLKYVPS